MVLHSAHLIAPAVDRVSVLRGIQCKPALTAMFLRRALRGHDWGAAFHGALHTLQNLNKCLAFPQWTWREPFLRCWCKGDGTFDAQVREKWLKDW